MDKKKKNIIAIAVVAVILIAIVVLVVVGRNNKDDKEKESMVTTTVSTETTITDKNADKATDPQDLPVDDEETTKKKSGSKKKDKNKETNFWDNVSVIEETQRSEPKTNKKGETITEEYPGQNDGWSPIVSPDDLEKDK